MKILSGFLLMICCFSGFAQDKKAQALTLIISKQESDWNKNDINAYVNSFSDDAVLINFLGSFWKGKAEIMKQFQMINECCIKPTQVRLDVLDTRFLNDVSAIIHIKETLTAKEDYLVPGGVIKKGNINYKFITAVFVKKNLHGKYFPCRLPKSCLYRQNNQFCCITICMGTSKAPIQQSITYDVL